MTKERLLQLNHAAIDVRLNGRYVHATLWVQGGDVFAIWPPPVGGIGGMWSGVTTFPLDDAMIEQMTEVAQRYEGDETRVLSQIKLEEVDGRKSVESKGVKIAL